MQTGLLLVKMFYYASVIVASLFSLLHDKAIMCLDIRRDVFFLDMEKGGFSGIIFYAPFLISVGIRSNSC